MLALLLIFSLLCAQAIAVIVAPAPAPASPKHVIVDSVGYAPLVLAMTSGELPVA